MVKPGETPGVNGNTLETRKVASEEDVLQGRGEAQVLQRGMGRGAFVDVKFPFVTTQTFTARQVHQLDPRVGAKEGIKFYSIEFNATSAGKLEGFEVSSRLFREVLEDRVGRAFGPIEMVFVRGLVMGVAELACEAGQGELNYVRIIISVVFLVFVRPI